MKRSTQRSGPPHPSEKQGKGWPECFVFTIKPSPFQSHLVEQLGCSGPPGLHLQGLQHLQGCYFSLAWPGWGGWSNTKIMPGKGWHGTRSRHDQMPFSPIWGSATEAMRSCFTFNNSLTSQSLSDTWICDFYFPVGMLIQGCHSYRGT